jgi:hypothetical protein
MTRASTELGTPFSLRKDLSARGTDFVVSDLHPEAREQLGDLDWLIPAVQPRGDEFAFTYPPGTPSVDAAFENLSRSAASMWRQHAEVDRADWQGAFRRFLSLADGTDIDWALIGGVSLAIRGVTAAAATPDVDIITTPDGARQLTDLLRDWVTSPAVDLPDFGWFGRAFVGAKIEWLGNGASTTRGRSTSGKAGRCSCRRSRSI